MDVKEILFKNAAYYYTTSKDLENAKSKKAIEFKEQMQEHWNTLRCVIVGCHLMDEFNEYKSKLN